MAVDVKHPSLIQPEADDIIYRYLDLDKFELLLKESALFFCRSDKFSDPFEGSVPVREANYRIQESKNLAVYSNRTITDEQAQKSSDSLGELHKNMKRQFIVNCWHINQGESDAMWRLYLKTNEGVAVMSTVQNLIDSLNSYEGSLYMSKVRYINYETDIYYHATDYPVTSYNLLIPIIHKRKAFSHESELRLFQTVEEAYNDETYWDNQVNHIGQNIPCNVSTLIQKVILPPKSDEFVHNKVKELLDKYSLKAALEMSKLTYEPVY